MEEERPSPQQLLRQIEKQKAREARGRLKIFFGYAAGVGKTYAMLEAAQQARQAGADVVAGYIERHTRPDTLALLEGLEQLAPKKYEYKSVFLNEFDLDAALARRPQLILVDELAHSNAPDCRHAKRYQDVEELLRAGIDVYTTVNVQHLESLHDLVASITGVAVSERFPDSVFDSAEQVELVDIEPDDLITRLQSGKVYKEGQAQRALDHFFSRENLSALREIAMRRTADRLNRTAQKEGNEAAARAREHILICLSSSPSNAKVIRTAARMSEAFHSGFTALFVETPGTSELRGEHLKRLRDNLRLAEQMGAQIATVYGDDPAFQIAEYAKVSGVTKIVLGRASGGGPLIRGKTLADKLTDLAGSLDIYIIPDAQRGEQRRFSIGRGEQPAFRMQDFLKTLLVITLATLIGFVFFEAGLRDANIVIIYILGVLVTAIWTHGQLYGALASLGSVLAFNFFFTVPRFTLHATERDYPVTFLIMLIASVMANTLTTRMKKQARQAAQKAYYTELLMSSSQKLQQGKDEEDIIRLAAEQLGVLLSRPILFALVAEGQPLQFSVTPAQKAEELLGGMTMEEMGVADWVAKNNKRAGATTDTFSHAQNLYMAIRGIAGLLGVVGIPTRFYPALAVAEKNLTVSILNECGLILERRRLRAEKLAGEFQARQGRQRANLLRAISHDLQPPLAGISGNADALLADSSLTQEQKQALYRSVYDNSMWLVNLTENLLSVTRFEDGTVRLKRRTVLLRDVLRQALSRLDRRAAAHTVTVEPEDGCLRADIDTELVLQVILNMINNAVKYTPAGSHIIISAKQAGEMIEVRIADDGPGISGDAKEHLFDLLYTVSQGKFGDGRGLGLGLNLCRSVVEAHGGSIAVTDNVPHGAVFTFTLPSGDL